MWRGQRRRGRRRREADALEVALVVGGEAELLPCHALLLQLASTVGAVRGRGRRGEGEEKSAEVAWWRRGRTATHSFEVIFFAFLGASCSVGRARQRL